MKDRNASANINAGHRKRLRERFLQCGIHSLAPHEILELLLTYSIPQKDVKPLAKMLLERFNDLNNVFNTDPELLMEQPGIKENSASLIALFSALNNYLQETAMKSGDLIANPLTAIRYLQSRIGRENREVMALIFLDSSNHALGCELLPGKSNRITFYPQNIARSMLQNRASKVIVAHNHPSGICSPSETDLQTTRVLKDFLEQLELQLVDHLLITKIAHLSLLNRIGCVFKNYSEVPVDPGHFDVHRSNLPISLQEDTVKSYLL